MKRFLYIVTGTKQAGHRWELAEFKLLEIIYEEYGRFVQEQIMRKDINRQAA